MIAALAADQAGARSLALDLVKGQRDLERGIGGFRPGIAEKYAIQPGGRELGDAACELKGLGNTELERRGIIQGFGLLGDRRRNLAAAMTGIGAPHARRGVDDLAAVDGKVMHVLGTREQPRRLLEGAIGGERHPVRGEVVRDVDGGGAWALVQHEGLLRIGDWRVWRTVSASLRDGNANRPYFSPFGQFEDGLLTDRRRRPRTPHPRNPRCRATAAAIAEKRLRAARGHGRSRTTARPLMSGAAALLSRC